MALTVLNRSKVKMSDDDKYIPQLLRERMFSML